MFFLLETAILRQIFFDDSPLSEDSWYNNSSRSGYISRIILEAFYSRPEGEAPQIRHYQDMLHQVAEMLWKNPHDTRPIQILYAYFVHTGSERMEATLQELGQVLIQRHALHFEETESLLNLVVKRLAAIGRMRHMQRQNPEGRY